MISGRSGQRSRHLFATWAAAILCGASVCGAAGAALAAPQVSMFFSGFPPGPPDRIGGPTQAFALEGDIFFVDVVVTVDGEGFATVVFDLDASPGLTAVTNSEVVTTTPAECPSPPNDLIPGTCIDPNLRMFAPSSPGVTDMGSSTTGYDVGGGFPTPIDGLEFTVGRAAFQYNAR